MLTVVQLMWFFVTDLISGGGDWSAIVTFVMGLVFLIWARSVDGGPNRSYGMWLHIGAGLTIGGSLLWFLHHGHFEWALIVVASLLFVKLASIFERASWAVLGSFGILAAAAHYTTSYSHASVSLGGASSGGSRGWVPGSRVRDRGCAAVRARRVTRAAHPRLFVRLPRCSVALFA